MVNTAKVQMPADYHVPEHITKGRAKDFAMAYWLTKEIGVVAMLEHPIFYDINEIRPPTEFYTKAHRDLAQDWLRFAVCKVLLESFLNRLTTGLRYSRRSGSAITKIEEFHSELESRCSTDFHVEALYRRDIV